jgi:hypothetical protein
MWARRNQKEKDEEKGWNISNYESKEGKNEEKEK